MPSARLLCYFYARLNINFRLRFSFSTASAAAAAWAHAMPGKCNANMQKSFQRGQQQPPPTTNQQNERTGQPWQIV